MSARAAAGLALAALAAAVAGCAVKAAPKHDQVLVNALADSTHVPSAWSAAPTDTIAANDDWLATFNDSSLNVVVRAAIANNANLRAAGARVARARAEADLVGAQLQPMVGIGASASITGDEGHSAPYKSNGLVLGVSWEVDVWGKVRSEHAAAGERYEATALDFSAATQSLAGLTARSWYSATEAYQLLDLARQSVSVYSQMLDLVNIRYQAGAVGELDVQEAKARVAQAQAQVTASQSILQEAQRNLEVLTGAYPSARIHVNALFAPVPPPVPAGLPSALLERRPDIAAAELRVDESFHHVQSAKLALLPSFSITGDAGRLDDGVLSILNANPNFYRAGLGLIAPLYMGGALRDKVVIASATQEEAVADYGAAVLNAFREVEHALGNETLLDQRLVALQAALVARVEAVRLATIKYQAGAIPLFDVLQLREEEIQTEALVIQVSNARLTNRIELHLALGGSFNATPAITPPDVPKPPEALKP
jgi:NodT family efflux transporter outer membrane factor (OMF) lipoprotein